MAGRAAGQDAGALMPNADVRGRFVPYVLGAGLLALALGAAVFTLYAVLLRERFLGFAATTIVTLPLGLMLRGRGRSGAEPSRREALVAVLVSWLLLPTLSAAPYVIDGGMSVLNAVFESMSGFTTTGATVLTDFSTFGKALFMWRASSQWVGGIGILVLFIAVFPQLAIAGRQLFFTEAPGPTEERLTPRLRNTAVAVLSVYSALTLACAIGYRLAGMSSYDAVAHALTTLAAGGFSPNGLSFAGFQSSGMEWVAILFMFFAGANFALLYRAATGRPRDLLRDAELRTYTLILLTASGVLTLLLVGRYSSLDAIRHSLFQVASIVTSTGYASADFALWSLPAQMLLVILMFVGGCAGSASGGVKVMRWLVLAKGTSRELIHALHPRAVLPVRVGARTVPEEVVRAVAAFLTLYIGLFAVTTLVLVMLGADFVVAFTAAISCLGNVGPGLESIGPMASFADLHPISRGLLTFVMYAGRLEVVTVFVVFTPGWWRSPHRRTSVPRSSSRREDAASSMRRAAS